MYGSSLTRFASLLFTARTSTAATASKEVTMITSTRGDGTLVFHLFAPEKPRDIAFYPIRP